MKHFSLKTGYFSDIFDGLQHFNNFPLIITIYMQGMKCSHFFGLFITADRLEIPQSVQIWCPV